MALPTQARKNAYYPLTTSITSAFKPQTPGTLKVCGRLTKLHSAVGGGRGAACGATKGWDGKGTVVFPGKPSVWLKDLEWKVDLAGTWIVTGDANDAATEMASKVKAKPDFFTATIKAHLPLTCHTKINAQDKQGARPLSS